MNEQEYYEFRKARMDGIGGSDVAAILGLSNYGSPMTVFRDKIIPPEPTEPEPDHREWGRRLEPVIAAWYEDFNDQGRTLTECGELMRSTDHPWMTANIDMWVNCPVKGRGVCEIKNVSAFMRGDWKDGPPLYYMVQMQHYLHVTGCKWGMFIAFLGNDCIWVDVERDEELIAKIIDATGELWQRVQDNNPPTADGHKETRKAIYALYPQGGEESAVALPDDATVWDKEILEAQEIVKRQEAIIDERKNLITQQMLKAGATKGVLHGEKSAYTLKANKNGVRTLRRLGDK